MKQPILEALFVNKPEAKLMRWLYVEAKPSDRLRTRELARAAGLPTGSVTRALNSLVSRQLIVREAGPYGPTYRAPSEDPRLKALFVLLRQDSEVVSLLKRALRGFKSIDYACVFGSFARGETDRESDIDVLILENDDRERVKVMTNLSQLSDKLGREVNPQFYRHEDFRHQVESGEPIALSILGNSRIVLKGCLPWLP